MKTYVVSLGCPKNTVDTEASLGLLSGAGCTFTDDPNTADLLIVSACSFLGSAWRETLEEVEELARIKREGTSKKLVLMGCLPVHRTDAWQEELPWVDHFLPTGGHSRLPALVESWRRGEEPGRMSSTVGLDRFAGFGRRVRLTPKHTAYVKIAEGCNRGCSFCAIPKVRGAFSSRSFRSIVGEVEALVEDGVKEVSLLSQDITSYAANGKRFPDLVDAIAGTGIEWIRIFYMNPGSLTLGLARRLFEHPSVCRYLEVPVQHASDRILERMRRSYKKSEIQRVLDEIRGEFPDVVIRSEVIVGFPGEEDLDFEELKQFVEAAEFASLGVFVYSPEPNTDAAGLGGTVSDSVGTQRAAELTDVQRSVTFGLLSREIGGRRRILVDRRVEEGSGTYPGCGYAGRFYGQAYEIDGEVYLRGGAPEIGTFVDARVTDTDVFDLEAVLD
ncbi:MAG: 30S ribosomal protein S12 methylthiotransferase RimO [Candidatus Latescibacterota bacterium]|nr:MAG: 30S ribosomal protein S12 methylthiotransferase RimO [Candidatus Latescibacterota bacterium]